jgi:trigger factor
MQVTETSVDGLRREFKITVPAGDIEGEIARRLDEIGRAVRVPGFRPGKVPMQILRRRFGQAVLGEVLENTVQSSSAEAITEHKLRPALPPKVDILSFGEGTDLEYKISLELLPEIPETDFGALGLERLVPEVPDEDVERAIVRMAEQQRGTEPVERPAEKGDVVVADLDAQIGGEPFPGGSGKDRHIELGSGYFVAGFEEQLLGVKAGETRAVNITFPADFGVPDLAGKEAAFTVAVKEVRQYLPAKIDDELAQAVGLETLAELKDEVRQRMRRDWEQVARLRLKRQLLDKLAERHDFPVPPGVVDIEFDSIWQQYQAEQEQRKERAASAAGEPAEAGENATEQAEAAEANEAEPPPGASEEEAKEFYRKIAERRVRLGLLLAEVGRSNNITVTQEELNQALAREARRHPGHERQVLDFYRRTPQAVGNLRAPIFEDKVVDFILELAKAGERKVTPRELMGVPQETAEEPASG